LEEVHDVRVVGRWAVERDDFDDYNVFDGGTDRTCPPEEAICFWNSQMNAIGQGDQYVPEDDIDHLAPPPGHLGPHARRSDLHCPDDGENSGDFGHEGMSQLL